MRQQQPAFVEFDGRAAVSDLKEFPRIRGLKNTLTAIPCVEVVRVDQMEVFVVLPSDHRVAAIDLTREQTHALVARCCSTHGRHAERSEVRRLQQFGPNAPAAVGRVGCVECLAPLVLEFNEASILDAVGLCLGDRKDDAFAQVFLGSECHLDIIAIGSSPCGS